MVSYFLEGEADTEVIRLVTRVSLENVNDNIIEASREEPDDTSNVEGYIVLIVSSDGSVVERFCWDISTEMPRVLLLVILLVML